MKHFVQGLVIILVCAEAGSSQGLNDITDAKTACLVNRGVDLSIMDSVREKLEKWSRWKLIETQDQADLLLILSAQEITSGIGGAVVATSPTSAVAVAGPLPDEKLFFAAVDRRTGNLFIVVSSYRHHLVRKAPAWLVIRMKEQVERHEKSIKKRGS